jgi:glutamate-1-semialdehyde aminotransferase
MDPLSMIAMAGTVVKGIETMVARGSEIEKVATKLGQWYTLAADITQAEQEAENPPLFKQLFYKQSVEQEALNATIAKQKLKEHEASIRDMICLVYGTEIYREMMAMRRQIRERRERTLYKQRRRRQLLIDSIAALVGLSFSGLVIYSAYWLIASA